MIDEKPELYFPRDVEWREWLDANHSLYPSGIYLIFYKLENKQPSMRWEEAVKVAYKLSQAGDTVLLSPSCASFDLFDSYEDRGRQFKNAVRDL